MEDYVLFYLITFETYFIWNIFRGEEEAALSNHRLWESIEFIITYAYGSFICVDAKLYVLLGVLNSGMMGYLFLEHQQSKKERQ
jgi:hypothetical protein